MNHTSNDSLMRNILTLAAVTGIAMSVLVLILLRFELLLTSWAFISNIVLWGAILWGMMQLRKISGGMPFTRGFNFGVQISFFSSFFVAFTYFIILTYIDPDFMETYFRWIEEFMYSMIPENLTAEQLETSRNEIAADIVRARENTTVMSYSLGKLMNFTLSGGLFSLLAAMLLRRKPVYIATQETHPHESQ